MSISLDKIHELNSPQGASSRKTRKNRVRSPLHEPPLHLSKRSDVFELFTIKTPQKVPSDSQDTSEFSDDVFVKPKPVSLSSPGHSETKSYRERINDRFRSVKEKAGKSTKRANVFKEATEKIMFEKVKRESNDLDAELEVMKERLKLGKTHEKKDVYEFFCNEKCLEVEEKETEDIDENIKSTENPSDERENFEFELPKKCRGLMKMTEDTLYFNARAEPVDIIDKIESEEPRLLEEEGIYVASKLNIPSRHVKLLEQRLSRDHKKWFNCDGTMNILENPCRDTSYRPWLKHLPTAETSTYIPAKIEDDECEEIVVVSENLLHLRISSLKFLHHPLFSIEHVHAEKLKKLFSEYEDSVLKNDLTRLCRRLEGIRRILKHWEENSSQSGDQSDKEDGKVEAYKRDIRDLQEKVFLEGKKERDRMKEILQTWKTIKKFRETNKFSNTTLRLIIRKEKVNYEDDQEQFHHNFEQTYEELLELNKDKSRRKRQDDEEIKEELQQRFRESFRAPGEPILHFNLTDENEVTNSVDNPKEVTRRNVVASTKIALKITCNKMEVCKTKWVNLTNDFICSFNETISIQLITIPKFVGIEIIEQPKSLIKRTVGTLSLKVPARNVAEKTNQDVYFEKDEIVHYKHEGVGSGVKINDLADVELHTCGSLTCSLSWNVSVKSEESLEYTKQIFNEIVNKNGDINQEKLAQWIEQHKPDPQDPRNSILYEYSLGVSDVISSTIQKKYFRLNQNMEQWQFCDSKVLENNLRLQVLQLRNRNEPEFDRMTVPNRIKEIPLDILSDYKRRVESERETILDDDDDEDEIDKKRSRGRKLLKQIQIRVFQKCKNSQNNLTFEDVIAEKFIPQLEKIVKDFVASFLRWFQWRPILPPVPQKEIRHQKVVDYDLQSQVRVVIKVISALNLPSRLEGKTEVVTPFVEAEYNSMTLRTSTRQGVHPTWNETLVLPLEPSHMDYLNPNSLNGAITLNIFDHKEKVLLKFGGETCRTWLGKVDIPLSAFSCNGIQGMFRVKTPNFLFGYEVRNMDKNKTRNPQVNQITFLNLEVHIEPNIPKLNPAIEDLPCSDLPYIRDHAFRWNEDYNTNFPNRKFSVFAIDTNATTSCLVRYIKPLEPPQINLDGFDVTPEQCARYVSLIPFMDCNQFYKNIWLPVDKFLHFMVGSIFDHAIALTCYFLALKVEAWLLLGFGLPHGTTAFVLVKEYSNNEAVVFSLYDVVYGEKIQLTDVFCPLQRVFCVVNERNIWANIQRNDDVTTMRFDFTRRSDWLPLFNNKIGAPTNSIHGDLIYLPKPATDELEIILDRKIRKAIAKLRRLDRTIWNHHVSNNFKQILNSLEKTEMFRKNQSDTFDEIRKITAKFKIWGHLLNSDFVNVSTVVKKVKSWGLHLEEDDNAQYASAVYVRAYPNQILSVWVFLAVIQQNETNFPN